MSKINRLILIGVIALVAGEGRTFAADPVNNDAALRSSIQQRMQSRALEQRLRSEDSNRRAEDAARRAQEDARRARERAINR